MKNEIIYELMRSITPLDALEREHQEDAMAWAQSGAELYRLEEPATPPKHLVSCIVLFDIETESVLLVDHKKTLLWVPPGGHVDLGEHPKDAACRELEEELGVNLPLMHPDPLFLTVTETVGVTAGHTDVSLWYLFKGNSSVAYEYDEGEFNGIKWFPIDELPSVRAEPHMRRFCHKLNKYLTKSSIQ